MMNSRASRLRVAFVTTGYPSESRPNQSVFIHRSIKALLPGIDAQVIHLRAWLPGRPWIKERKWEGVNVVTLCCLQSPRLSDFHHNTRFLSKIGGIALRSFIQGADLVHSTDLYPAGYIANRWAKACEKPHTSHVIGSDVNFFLTPNIAHVGRAWLYDIHGFVCNSRNIMGRLLELAPDLNNLHVIYRGVDTSFFSPEGYLSGPQVTQPPVRFLFLGGFHSANPGNPLYSLKGGPLLLDAWEQVEERISPSTLLIGGPGTNESQLEKWRASLKKPEAVFLSNVVGPRDVPSLLRACDVLVVPSQNEGLPNIANEAQACCCPVLGTDAGGIPESVIHTVTGRIVPRGNVDALAEGLEWFHSNLASIPVMGQNGRSRMLQDFSWEKFSNKMMTFFSDVI